jgi:surfeit locus 1 family protein
VSLRPLLRPFALGMHVVAAVLVAIAVLLGFWQVQVWQDERSDEAADRAHLEPVPLTDSLGPDEAFPTSQVGMPVRVTGTWVPEGTVQVSGRRQGDQDGYWVVTPLAVATDGADEAAPGAAALLVVRGWIPALDDVPPAPEGAAEVVGWLQPPEGSTGTTDDDRSDDVIPQVRIADAIQHVDQDLYGAYLVLDQDAEGVSNTGNGDLAAADLDQLPPVGRGTGIRNLLYGIEWWVFAGFAGFIWWRWCADEVRAARQAAVAAELSARDTVGA